MGSRSRPAAFGFALRDMSARTSAIFPVTIPIVAAIPSRARTVGTAQTIASATSGIAMVLLTLGRCFPRWTTRQEPRTAVGIFAACVVKGDSGEHVQLIRSHG